MDRLLGFDCSRMRCRVVLRTRHLSPLGIFVKRAQANSHHPLMRRVSKGDTELSRPHIHVLYC